VTTPLDDLVVADLSSGIAGAYATKLLADGGAEVVMVEGPDGDPLRGWSAAGATIPPGEDGALFNHLAASKRSVVVDPDADHERLDELLSGTDAVVWSRGSSVAEHASLSPAALRQRHPHLVVTAITPFGQEGEWSHRPATDLTLQAWSGGAIGLGRGDPAHPPVSVGGQLGEWLAGAFAAVGTLAALRRAGDSGELVDVSMLEAMATCMTYYPVTFHDQLGRPMRRKRFVPTPGVAAAGDGLVGLGCGTGQQWLDFCVMVGHPEWQDDPKLFLERTALAPIIDAWVAERTVDEVLELASAFRIPNAPIAHGANVTTFDHFRQRGTFVTNPRDGATNPRPPFRLSSVDLRPAEPAPRLGQHTEQPLATRRSGDEAPRRPSSAASGTRGGLPFSGLRVLDMTAYWAGPFVGHLLALLGADVIHLESAKRPDGVRLVGGVPQTEERFWERGPIFSALNVDKRSLTIDFGDERGADLVRRFVSTCDVVVENYTPRVLDQAGLGYEALRAHRRDLVMVRMPGFGLDGPWRDLSAFAFVIEDASGLTWRTGHPDRLPIEPYCVGDPTAGLHALLGLQLALAHRDRTGEGCLVEAAMVDAALNVAAEQVVEHSAYGVLLERTGNRGPAAAPQNLYRTSDVDERGRADTWVAIAVATDEQWTALRGALGEPDWAADDVLATHAGRVRAHDQIDEHLAAWCAARTAEEVVARLWSAGVPVGKVMQPHEQPDLPPLQERGFFETAEHPVIGPSRYSTLPMRFSEAPHPAIHGPAPLLGEHNDELLAELGLSPADIEALEADGIIGRSLTVRA
jgi:crotonobetainyl-CoA:carnitine CoA-transferase CaiB-like acyl-CoA transferase